MKIYLLLKMLNGINNFMINNSVIYLGTDNKRCKTIKTNNSISSLEHLQGIDM